MTAAYSSCIHSLFSSSVWFFIYFTPLCIAPLLFFTQDLQLSVWCLCCDGKVSCYCSVIVWLHPCVWLHCISASTYFSTCGCDAVLSHLEACVGYDDAWLSSAHVNLNCCFLCTHLTSDATMCHSVECMPAHVSPMRSWACAHRVNSFLLYRHVGDWRAITFGPVRVSMHWAVPCIWKPEMLFFDDGYWTTQSSWDDCSKKELFFVLRKKYIYIYLYYIYRSICIYILISYIYISTHRYNFWCVF
jgi:hypothetical protein